MLEVCRRDGEPNSPETLYQICCGLLCLLKEADKAEVNILSNPMFYYFRAVLDSRMKELNATGKHQARKHQEDYLWQKGLLADKHPQQLLDILIFLY